MLAFAEALIASDSSATDWFKHYVTVGDQLKNLQPVTFTFGIILAVIEP